MDNIQKFQKQTMSSREIAQLTGKNHRDVMRAIRRMEPAWHKVTGTKFEPSKYTDPTGRKLPEYLLTKLECLYIATKFNDEARAKLVIRWEELERQASKMFEVNIDTLRNLIKEELAKLNPEPKQVNSADNAKIGYSVEQLADMSGFSIRTIQRLVNRLNIKPIAYWVGALGGRPAGIYPKALGELLQSGGQYNVDL